MTGGQDNGIYNKMVISPRIWARVANSFTKKMCVIRISTSCVKQGVSLSYAIKNKMESIKAILRADVIYNNDYNSAHV